MPVERGLNTPGVGEIDPDDGSALVHGIMEARRQAVTAALDALAAEVAGLDKIVYGHPLDDAVYRAAVLAAIEARKP